MKLIFTVLPILLFSMAQAQNKPGTLDKLIVKIRAITAAPVPTAPTVPVVVNL